MSLTTSAWLGLFIAFTVLTFRRSSWGIPLYIMTFYAHPEGWWWGSGLLTSMGIRWNLLAALIFAVGVLFDGREKPARAGKSAHAVLLLLLLYAVNASVVHLQSASDPEESWLGLVMVWKNLGLLVLMLAAIRDNFDLKLMIYSVILGASYIGYEVYFNDVGHLREGRLEGIPLLNADEADNLAGLLCLSIPLCGYLLFVGKRIERLVAFISVALILEIILRCVSRGAFLALIGGGVWLAAGAKGRVRYYAMAGAILAGVAAFVMMGEAQEGITTRFLTTFAPSESRDESAQSRLHFWSQALKMIGDHPLGSGGTAAFRSDLGYSYLEQIGVTRRRAVHNGYLNIAAGWGVQGLLIYLAALLLAWRRLRAGVSLARSLDNHRASFLGCCIDAALVTQLITCMFISTLGAEWFFWWMAMALGYQRVVSPVATGAYDYEQPELHPQHALPEQAALSTFADSLEP